MFKQLYNYQYFIIFLILSSCTSPQAQKEISSLPSKEYLKQESVRCSFMDSKGMLWFGTNYGELYQYDGTNLIVNNISNIACSPSINKITEDNYGNLWFANTEGLCKFDGKTYEQVDIPWDGNEDLWGPDMNANNVLSIAIDDNQNIWFGTWGNGAHYFNPNNKDQHGKYNFTSLLQEQGSTYEGGAYRNVIQTIFKDNKGAMWLTSLSHGGINKYEGGNITNYHTKEGLKDDMVFSGIQDRDGTYWFGMLGNRPSGLIHFNSNQFTNYTIKDGLPNNNVTSVFQDHTGRIWLGSGRGELNTFHPENTDKNGNPIFEIFKDQDGNSFKNITFVNEDQNHNIWFGGQYGQLYMFDGKTVKQLNGTPISEIKMY